MRIVAYYFTPQRGCYGEDMLAILAWQRKREVQGARGQLRWLLLPVPLPKAFLLRQYPEIGPDIVPVLKDENRPSIVHSPQHPRNILWSFVPSTAASIIVEVSASGSYWEKRKTLAPGENRKAKGIVFCREDFMRRRTVRGRRINILSSP